MSQQWDNQPNRQKALETTIPTLSGIMLALIGALFVAAAITDIDFLKNPTDVNPLIISEKWGFTIPGERRLLVLFLCALSGVCFYRSMMHCVWSQISFYDSSAVSHPDVTPVLETASPEERLAWAAIQIHWDKERRRHAGKALIFFNVGVNLLLLPLVFLLPPKLLALGFYVWFGSLPVFYRNWRRQ